MSSTENNPKAAASTLDVLTSVSASATHRPEAKPSAKSSVPAWSNISVSEYVYLLSNALLQPPSIIANGVTARRLKITLKYLLLTPLKISVAKS